MANARLHKEPSLDDLDVNLFEHQRIKKLEIAIAVLVSLIVLAWVGGHFIGQSMPGPGIY